MAVTVVKTMLGHKIQMVQTVMVYTWYWGWKGLCILYYSFGFKIVLLLCWYSFNIGIYNVRFANKTTGESKML